MKLAVESPARSKSAPDTVILFAFEKDARPLGDWKSVDPAIGSAYAEAARREDFQAGDRKTLLFHGAGKVARVIVAGLGARRGMDAEKIRRGAAMAVNRIKSGGASTPRVVLPLEAREIPAAEQAQAAAEGILLALYEYRKYKSRGKAADAIREVRFPADGEARDVGRAVERARIFAEATIAARDLVNEPPSVCTPRYLADAARRTVRGARGMSIRVIDERQAKRLGMGGLLGVAAGSTEPPRFVHMTYRSPGARRTIAVCGKGITFDSGGLCLKPADGMLNMKDDMSGAAAVIGIFQGLRGLRPRVNVHGIFAASENMPGGSAYKTRDVLRAMNGKTMEIINTDAEGRLVLSDALSYASRLKPDAIVDLATLTGACVVALGHEVAGIFGTNQELVNRLLEAGRATGEKIWQLPLVDEYWDLIKSDVADMKNSGGRYGGSITAALFLREFVAEGIPWAHIDIAGPALTESSQPYKPAGGTGAGVRTMLRYLESIAS